ncbi:hypothetical protein F0562_015821 [Nyssa sinensis]|uniref:DNA-3-methyladenine glycosylase II n=1 Tax=Nyssa sinensis TaxID=561372 RepID=A0A5J4ZKZ1_9ASTE|nr:hypothetical protein F0562_015821 [Nyssa sinensis]
MKRTKWFKRVSKPKKAVQTTDSSSAIIVAKPKNKPKVETPLPSISISQLSNEKSTILASDFYQIDALDLAPLLLGKYLRRDDVVLQITEVEAYRPNDSACHGRFGITARTAPVDQEVVVAQSQDHQGDFHQMLENLFHSCTIQISSSYMLNLAKTGNNNPTEPRDGERELSKTRRN